MSIEQEMERYRRDVVKEQQRNEQRAAVLKKLEGQAQYLVTQVDKVRAKQAELQVGAGWVDGLVGSAKRYSAGGGSCWGMRWSTFARCPTCNVQLLVDMLLAYISICKLHFHRCHYSTQDAISSTIF